jgi:hypothetical protein
MCFSQDIPDAPPPPPPPPPNPVFQAGSELDTDSANASTSTKKGKDALTTARVDTGLGIPTGA